MNTGKSEKPCRGVYWEVGGGCVAVTCPVEKWRPTCLAFDGDLNPRNMPRPSFFSLVTMQARFPLELIMGLPLDPPDTGAVNCTSEFDPTLRIELTFPLVDVISTPSCPA